MNFSQLAAQLTAEFNQVKARRDDLREELRKIYNKAEREKRNLTRDEQKEWDRLVAERDACNNRIDDLMDGIEAARRESSFMAFLRGRR